jgi:adenosylcobyric acid synthase
VSTEFDADKLQRQVSGYSPRLRTSASGYEIRHGRVHRDGGDPFLSAFDHTDEGCVSGATFGTSWHGLLECDELRRAFLASVAEHRGRRWVPGKDSFRDVRERHLDRLGDLAEEHLDTAALLHLIENGAPAGPAAVA